MIPTALTVFLLFLSVALFLRVWHLQGHPVYSKIPSLPRRTFLAAIVALFGAALAQSTALGFKLNPPEVDPPPTCHQLVLDDMCEEELHKCEDTLLAGEKAMLTYDNQCPCPWSPLTLETLNTP